MPYVCLGIALHQLLSKNTGLTICIAFDVRAVDDARQAVDDVD
jgi:hypothetical protein